MKLQTLSKAALISMAALVMAGAQAQLFESNYASHTQAFTLADDEVLQVPVSGSVMFYGASYSQLSLSTNGNINFAANNDFFAPSFPSASAGAVIAPLWADWFVDTTIASDYSRLFYSDSASRFIATWDVRLVNDETVKAVFQVVLDKANGDIKFGFGDIDPRYAQYVSDNGNRTGLNAGDGTRFADNYQNFVVSNTQRFYSFEPVSGNYTVVPEPATVTALSLGALALLRRKRR